VASKRGATRRSDRVGFRLETDPPRADIRSPLSKTDLGKIALRAFPDHPASMPSTTAHANIEAANANWQSHRKGEGNAACFRLAVAYKHAGISWMDAEPLPRQQAHWAHSGSQAERLSDLRDYGHKIWRN
jgi:hypothetical protein